jgi:predicted DNA-binding protein
MALTDAVAVRFNQSQKDRLSRVALASGMSEAELIRRATDKYLDEAEKSGSITIRLKEQNTSYSSQSQSSKKKT